MKPQAAFIGLFVLTLCFATTAWPHGDAEHLHAEASATSEPAPRVATQFPRTSAKSEEFELVAVLVEKRLTLYLDDYASNTPVANAQIEIESGAFKSVAKQIEPGVYALPGDHFKQPGTHTLVFSIQTDTTADLLTATLAISQPVAVPRQTQNRRMIWIAAGVLLLAAISLVLIRRKQ